MTNEQAQAKRKAEIKDVDIFQANHICQSGWKSEPVVRKSQYALTVMEAKIVNFILANIDPRAQDCTTIRFAIRDFCAACGLSSANPKYIRETIKKLADKSMAVKQKQFTADDRLEKESYVPVRWIEDWEIDLTGQQVIIRLHDRLKPYFLELRKNYTSAELYGYLNFHCKYSFPLYDLVKSYANIEYETNKPFVLKLLLTQFRELLDLKDKLPRFWDIQERVLNPALEDINRYTDLNVSVQGVYRKKAIVGLEFTIRYKPIQARYALESEASKALRVHQRRLDEPIVLANDEYSVLSSEDNSNADVIEILTAEPKKRPYIVMEDDNGQCLFRFSI